MGEPRRRRKQRAPINPALICGPGASDKSFAKAMSDTAALAILKGYPLTLGCMPGVGGNYDDDEVSILDGVNVVALSEGETTVLDMQLNLASGARASLDGLSIINTSEKRALNLTGLAGNATLLARRCFIDSQGTTNATIDVDDLAVLLLDRCECRQSGANANGALKMLGGVVSTFLATRFSHQINFDTHAIAIDGGSFFGRGLNLVNPGRVSGSAFAFINGLEQNAFQIGVSRPGSAWNIESGSTLILRGNIDIAGADGENNPVFTGTPQATPASYGSIDHTDIVCPDLGGTGVVIDPLLSITSSGVLRGTDL